MSLKRLADEISENEQHIDLDRDPEIEPDEDREINRWQALWRIVQEDLRWSMHWQEFYSMIAPLSVVDIEMDGDRVFEVCLAGPDKDFIESVQAQYGDEIKNAITRTSGKAIRVSFAIDPFGFHW